MNVLTICSALKLQAFGFFNEVVIEKCFGLLKMLGLEINCMTFLEDIEILLGIVSLDDYLDVKQTLIENVSTVLGLYYTSSIRGRNGNQHLSDYRTKNKTCKTCRRSND